MKKVEQDLSWIVAFSDKTAGIHSVPQCMTTGDVFGDGNFRILIASLDQKLICFDGPRITQQMVIPDMPSCLCVHYSGSSSSSLPLVAVGAGNSIFFFLNLRQFSKFSLPPPFKTPDEESLFAEYKKEGGISIIELQHHLKQIKASGKALCSQSLAFINADLSNRAISDRYVSILENIASSDCITTMASIKCNALHEDKATRLLIGTESKSIFLLDAKDTSVERTWDLDAPPSTIRASGYLAGASTIAIICRDSILRIISNMNEHPISVRCDSIPIDVAISSSTIYVALMSMCVKVFDSLGKLLHVISFDRHILCVIPVVIEERQLSMCCVACANGQISFLEKNTVNTTMELEEGISSIFFGRVGRETNNLLMLSSYGGLYLRILSRINTKKTSESPKFDVVAPLPIPRKNQLFLQQTQYEQKNSKEMYHAWQNTMRYLMMISVNTYAQIIESSVLSPIDDISFTVDILGMGPSFIIVVYVSNTGKEIIDNINVIIKHEKSMYKVNPSLVVIPSLQGGCKYSARFNISSINKEGKTDSIHIVSTSPKFPVPLYSSNISMPVSQFPVE